MTVGIRRISAIVVAAGRGERAGAGFPKQYRSIGGRPVLARALDPFLKHASVDSVVVAIRNDDRVLYHQTAPKSGKLRPPVVGGDTRQASVHAALASFAADPPDVVLIHDGARPFVSAGLVERVIEGVGNASGVIPTLPITSTIKSVEGNLVTATVRRDGLYIAETPQAFPFGAILDAHQKAEGAGMNFTDDAALAEWAGIPVSTVEGEVGNLKLTTEKEIILADRQLTLEAALKLGDVRVGIGYDIHPFGPGDAVTLCGIHIPHRAGLLGHSDADVALHAVTDAILGALGDGDIGSHFPPSDERWKGARSDRFLVDALRRLRDRNGVLAHIDIAIVAEEPKIGPHREVMRARIAEICGIRIDRIGIKATTNEKLGSIGRGEGIAVHAVVTVRLPFDSGDMS